MFNVIFSFICDLRGTRVVEKRGLARQQCPTWRRLKQPSKVQVTKSQNTDYDVVDAGCLLGQQQLV